MSQPPTAYRLPPTTCDLAIIGAGLAGMSAAVFAGNRGLRVVHVGNAGALLFSSGLLDLMAVHPIEEGRCWSDPWAAAAAVARDVPGHPYAKVPPAEIRAGFAELVSALGDGGLGYGPPGDASCELLTSAGTVKTTYCAPRTMLPGAAALAERAPCLLVDFEGLREYSAREIAQTAKERWPQLRTARIDFPIKAVGGETYAAHLAQAFELAEHRAALAALVRPHLGGARAVGLPAVLGVRKSEQVAAELARELGVTVFELPTLPTSVPGLRLKGALERAVARRGVARLPHARAVAVAPHPEGFEVRIDGPLEAGPVLRSRAVILATGRFMGRGLVADRARIREPLMDLPVVQPPSRDRWHRTDFFDPRGHGLSRAGVEVDGEFRPCGAQGGPLYERLFAIGTLLANQDWARMKCGAGVAIASARGAVLAAERELGRRAA